MSEKTGQADATATASVAAKERGQEAIAITDLTISSEVVVFDEFLQVDRIDPDGTFILRISDTGEVTGDHVRPSPHPKATVRGRLTPVSIILNSDDGDRVHSGARLNFGGTELFIGTRRPPGDRVAFQEEGVWVGTKVGP